MSARFLLTVAVLGLASLGAAPGRADPPAANPLDVVPDKMPFDVP
jgi:hypothetical protein